LHRFLQHIALAPRHVALEARGRIPVKGATSAKGGEARLRVKVRVRARV
jgi:hypothetical protein